jgi:hypothetical protein
LEAADSAQKVTVYKRDKNGKFVRQFAPGDKGDSIEEIIRQNEKDEAAVQEIRERLIELQEIYGDDSRLGRYDLPGGEACLLSKLAYDDAMKCLQRQKRLERAVVGSTRSADRKREISGAPAADDHEKSSVDFAR